MKLIFRTKEWFINLVEKFHQGTLSLVTDALGERTNALKQLIIEGSTVFVKLCYAGLFSD